MFSLLFRIRQADSIVADPVEASDIPKWQLEIDAVCGMIEKFLNLLVFTIMETCFQANPIELRTLQGFLPFRSFHSQQKATQKKPCEINSARYDVPKLSYLVFEPITRIKQCQPSQSCKFFLCLLLRVRVCCTEEVEDGWHSNANGYTSVSYHCPNGESSKCRQGRCLAFDDLAFESNRQSRG